MSVEQLFAPGDAGSDWELVIDGFYPSHEGAVESLFAVANGYLGTRASIPEGHAASNSGTFIAGVYDHFRRPGPVPELIRTADWLALRVYVEGELLSLDAGTILEHRRVLDLRRGVVTRFWRHLDGAGRITRMRYLHIASLAGQHTLVQRFELTPENYTSQVAVEVLLDANLALEPETSRDFIGDVSLPFRPAAAAHLVRIGHGHDLLTLKATGSRITVAEAIAAELNGTAAAVEPLSGGPHAGKRWTWTAALGHSYRVDKLVAVETSRDVPDPQASARLRLQSEVAAGAVALIASHEHVWAHHWAGADIEIDGAPKLQRALRLAIYHLISAANGEDERVSVGARGLTGDAYKGHVFWDTEIFVLPFFMLTAPATARALLMYRFHTLPAARAKARRLGYRGALYAWESAANGEEATPTEIVGADDSITPIQSGAEEHHISADVAYAVWQYWQATRDEAFLCGAGAEIICETARFWASRVVLAADGKTHIRGVVGPDEYHDGVDDNAYTNLLARWNLQRGIEVIAMLSDRWPAAWQHLRQRLRLSAGEVAEWRTRAESLLDGLNGRTGLIEQFAGYFALEDIEISALPPATVPVDVQLGHARIRSSQVVKQADVLMALYLLWDEFPIDVHRTNFRYYERRTAHGSSLSPGVHAAFAARLGELELAGRYLRETAAIDLDDQMGNAAGGIHMAALGSLWQAAVFGFIGITLLDDRLRFCPRLPAGWTRLNCSFCWRGRLLALSLSESSPSWSLTLKSGGPLLVDAGAADPISLPPGASVQRDGLGEPISVREAGE